MPLHNKYLKYSPEITLEIFTLVWDKLIESGFKHKYDNELHNEFKCFKDEHNYLIIEDNVFNTYLKSCIFNSVEITVQEILGYDPFIKETKEIIPEYVECLKDHDTQFTKGKIYEVKGIYNSTIDVRSDDEGNSNGWVGRFFKPSTKEAYNLQQLSKSIEKWSVGSYVVFLNNYGGHPKGTIDVIIKDNNYETIKLSLRYNDTHSHCNLSKNAEAKWFATKSEAEEFAKTLVESVKEKVKNPLKQAVHCKTQEEYKIVKEFYKQIYLAHIFNVDTSDCIPLEKQYCTSSCNYYKDSGYQILSFQEWCDLNGYKMEKEVEFKVGKWYKNSNKTYAKCKSSDNFISFWYEEWINNGKFEYKKDKWYNHSKITIAFIEEIQQYLPDEHPDKIKSNREFKVGDYVYHRDAKVFKIAHLKKDFHQVQATNLKIFGVNSIRHATPEEINNHLISIGEIPAGEPLNNGIEPNKDGMFKYTTYNGTTQVGKTSIISGTLKMILSIDDEELPMVNTIKTNSIKQLLSND